MQMKKVIKFTEACSVIFIAMLFMLLTQVAPANAAGKIPLNTTDIAIESGQTYTISNKEELLNFAEIARTGANFQGSTVELLSDITWWQPIATHSGQTAGTFLGIFEGNNHTISGLVFDFDSGGEHALFGRCDGAVIRNVTVENFYFRGANCAGICAVAWNGTVIENCHAIDGILANRGYSGGILGMTVNAWGDSNAIIQIENCTSRCEILEGCYHLSGGENIGLIVGYAREGVTVENCNNTGEAFGADYKTEL